MEDTVLEQKLTSSQAAKGGLEVLKKAWYELPEATRETLKAALNRRHIPAAKEADEKKFNAPQA